MSESPGASSAATLGLEPWLLEILACPQDRAPLRVDVERSELVCTGCGLAFSVRDGIPVLLIEDARQP